MQNKNLFLFLLLLCYSFSLTAQTRTQTIRGQILDKETRQTLAGATISVLDQASPLGAVSDADGNFIIQQVPTGRHRLQCSYVGYEPFVTDNLIVNSAREVVLNIELLEASNKMGEVVVNARKFGSEPINELAVVSTRSFSVDETQRYAASGNDPGRMAMGFPGVQPSRDSRSDIIIRGNSGVGLLWRLEGIEIPNPNHFARRGTSGGGITIFSVSMLGQSDFSTGAFPAEYGNAVAGVFDMRFRRGNAEKREYTFRAGLLGLDFSTEGPFSKNSKASYLVNYRYSTLGILNNLGIHLVGPRTNNTFQDLSFNLAFPGKNNKHTFTLWGIGGNSKEFYRTEDQDKWQYFEDWRQYNFVTNMGAVGATHTVLLGDDAYLRTNLALMGQKITVADDTLNTTRLAGNYNNEAYTENRLALSTTYSKKFSSRVSLKAGLQANQVFYDLQWRRLEGEQFRTLLGSDGSTTQLQPFANLRLRVGTRTTINAGLTGLYLALNGSGAIEPRLGMRYQINEKQAFSLAAGLHSRVLPLGAYFYDAGGRDLPNLDLALMKAVHLVAGYDIMIRQGWKFRPEIYWQHLYDVPVAAAAGDTWSMLNTISGFPDRILSNEGTGRNMGLDLIIEKSFEKGAFLILSGSVFSTTYTDNAGKRHSTTFNSGSSATLMGGQEWKMKRNSTLQLGLKVLYNGGQRLTPLLPGGTVNRYLAEPALDQSRPFTEQVQAYFRPDLRIAWRKDGRSAWTLALDVQNFINRRNQDPINRSYDPDRNTWIFREQSGLTPILSFQLDL